MSQIMKSNKKISSVFQSSNDQSMSNIHEPDHVYSKPTKFFIENEEQIMLNMDPKLQQYNKI